MEEVDKIILNQLNNIGCDLNDEVSNLNEIDNNDLMNAFITCVRMIDEKLMPNHKFNQNMNITEKYRIATDLANAIKQSGYKAEIGYQTFLYFNEKELRRLFLFLFDKLFKQKQDEPKYVNKSLLNRLKSIEIDFSSSNVKVEQEFKWKTDGVEYLNYSLKNKVRNCVPFDNPSLFIEWNALNLNQNSKLFTNFYQNSKLVLKNKSVDLKNFEYIDSKSAESSPKRRIEDKSTGNSDEQLKILNDQLQELEQQLELKRAKLIEKETILKVKKESLQSLNKKFDEKKLELDKVRYSDRSNEELKEGIAKVKHEIDEVNKKWIMFNLKYDETINELREKKKSILNKFNEINEEILSTRDQIELSKSKLKKIDEQSTELKEDLNDDNKLDRKFYTKRIFEIINNVKKQEQDIAKILVDVREQQRDINQLSGKVTRVNQVVEETIFKNSNLTDWSKRCYRLISELDEIYDKLINQIELSGQTNREISRLEEILESEKSNKIGSNLAQVTYHLEQIRKGNI